VTGATGLRRGRKKEPHDSGAEEGEHEPLDTSWGDTEAARNSKSKGFKPTPPLKGRGLVRTDRQERSEERRDLVSQYLRRKGKVPTGAGEGESGSGLLDALNVCMDL